MKAKKKFEIYMVSENDGSWVMGIRENGDEVAQKRFTSLLACLRVLTSQINYFSSGDNRAYNTRLLDNLLEFVET